jgi:predicted alpha-1,2-mannosidase
MYIHKNWWIVSLCAEFAFLFGFLAISAHAQTAPYDQVDPFIGTQTSQLKDNGNTLPGATRPFGMLYWSPDSAEGNFYRYEDPVTRGFSLMHLSGPGCGVFGEAPIFPMLGLPNEPPPQVPLSYRAGYKHSDEIAQPGYYSVKLDSGITIQIAADVHSGIAKVHYPAGTLVHTLLIDLSRNLTRVADAQIQIDGNHVTGSVESGGFCGLQNHYKVYFSLRTEETPQSSGTFNELRFEKKGREGKGPHAGGYLSFSPTTTTVQFKVGLSFVSIANADGNLVREIPGWDFEKVRGEAKSSWKDVLSHAVVSGGSEAQRKVFYTAMYHSFLQPNVFSDGNGEYIGFDDKVHTAKGRIQYANYSGWDIYRSQVQLITMLMPKVGSDMAQSLVADAEEGGGLPIWPVANDESSVMVGDPSDGILAGIYAFGGHDFDAEAALRVMVRGAEDPAAHSRLYPERPGLAEYLQKGYIAASPAIGGSAAVTLEDESADFAISQLALSLHQEALSKRYLSRSANWTKLFDTQTGYIRPKDPAGNFSPKFDITSWDGFVEGNAAQYTWMVPYDLKGLIQTVGGNAAVNHRLDDYFSQYGSWALNRGPYFFIANEPSFGNPWIYNWSGEPWHAQEVVRKTLHDIFTATPDGEPGNDDLGATSSWIVFSQLGMFPEIPGVGGLAVNSPVFPKAVLKLGDHEVRIIAAGAPEELYVRELNVDGKRIRNWWLDWDVLRRADEVRFTLSPTPVKEPGEPPPSFAPTAILPTPIHAE